MRPRRVTQWAIAQGYRSDNPAGDAMSGTLPNDPARRKYQRALPYTQVGAAIRRVRASNAYRGTVLAFEFLLLTAYRSSEILKADWREIDRERSAAVSAARMKTGREHRVPLSDRALSVLDEARRELLTHSNSLDTCIAVPVRFRCLSGNPFVPMASHSFPPTPPRRNVDLSHIRFNPDGSRFVDLAALKSRPNVQAQLQAIRKRREAAKSSSG